MRCTLEGPGWPSGSKSHSSKAHGLWAPAQVLQPKQEPRSSDAPPCRLRFTRVISVLATAKSGAFPVGSKSPSALSGVLVLAPVSSFGMQALSVPGSF